MQYFYALLLDIICCHSCFSYFLKTTEYLLYILLIPACQSIIFCSSQLMDVVILVLYFYTILQRPQT